MAITLEDLLKQFAGGAQPQGSHYNHRTVTMPRDPDILAYLTANGIPFTAAPGGLIQSDIYYWPVQKGITDNTTTTVGGGGGGGSSFSGGGGGGGVSAPVIPEALINQYLHVANVYHVDVTRQEAIAAINNKMPFDNWQTKIITLSKIDHNGPWLNQFSAVARANGKKGLDTFEEQRKFVMGESDKDLYNFWDELALRGSLEQAGVTTKNQGVAAGDTNLKRADVLAGLNGLGPLTVDQARVIAQNYAKTIMQTGAYGRFLGNVVSERDVLKAAAGTSSAGTNIKIASLLATENAFQHAAFAKPQLVQTPTGTSLVGQQQQEGQSL